MLKTESGYLQPLRVLEHHRKCDANSHSLQVAIINPGGPVNTDVSNAANQTDLPCLAIFIVERRGVFGHDLFFY